jgi:hypothetical protein
VAVSITETVCVSLTVTLNEKQKKLLVVKNTITYSEFMLKTAFQLWGFASGLKYEL